MQAITDTETRRAILWITYSTNNCLWVRENSLLIREIAHLNPFLFTRSTFQPFSPMHTVNNLYFYIDFILNTHITDNFENLRDILVSENFINIISLILQSLPQNFWCGHDI